MSLMELVLGRSRAHKYEQDLQQQRITRLATYNSEVHRGLVHTPEWKAYMAAEQVWFDALPRPS
jgi:hypothetical protein